MITPHRRSGPTLGRRQLARLGAAMLSASWGAPRLSAAAAPQTILVLGGTGFIGPHLVRLAVTRGHRVTIFTRGRRSADLPEAVERLVGDRSGDLAVLAGRRWDVVIDDSATNPDWVRASTQQLASSGRYLFTSSTGVYYPYLRHGLTEADPVRTEAADPADGSASFGARKAQCEAVVQRAFGDRGVVVRPTYIVGPGDYTDRFTYWPVRLAEGGTVLAPGGRQDPVQFIDVRDLAAFMLTLVERAATGIYNAVGPSTPMSIETFLRESAAALAVSPTFVWVDDPAVLDAHGLDGMVPWVQPRGNDLGHTSVRTIWSMAAGLTHRPLAQTTRDTLAWFRSLPEERRASAKWVLARDTERDILAAWSRRTR